MEHRSTLVDWRLPNERNNLRTYLSWSGIIRNGEYITGAFGLPTKLNVYLNIVKQSRRFGLQTLSIAREDVFNLTKRANGVTMDSHAIYEWSSG